MSYKVRVIKSASKGVERFDNETNDCTVRALANAYGMSYKLAHRIMSKAGRKQGKGPQLGAMHHTYTRLGFEIDRIHGETNAARYLWNYLPIGHSSKRKGATLGRILPVLGIGRFIVLIRGHVFAVVNGQILDDGDNLANSHVAAVYKLPEQHVLFNQ